MKNKFNKLVEIATALKPLKQNYRCFHTAFVIKRKKIYSIGWNDASKTHPHTIKYPYNPDSKIHAELMAVLKLKKKDCSGLTLVVLRLDRFNHLRNSKPCKGCAAFLKDFNFDEIWYSTNDQTFMRDEVNTQ